MSEQLKRLKSLSLELDIRLPDFRYSTRQNSDADQSIQNFFNVALLDTNQQIRQSLIKSIRLAFPATALAPSFINLAFSLDRLIDTWLRKSQLEKEVSEALSVLRALLFAAVYGKSDTDAAAELMQLGEEIAGDMFAWRMDPRQSAIDPYALLLRLIDELCDYRKISLSHVQHVRKLWRDARATRLEKFSKVTERLISSEQLRLKTQSRDETEKDSNLAVGSRGYFDTSSGNRFLAIKRLAQPSALVCVTFYGVKHMTFTEEADVRALNHAPFVLQSKLLSLQQVLDATIRGFEKILETQQVARQAASEKAIKEAALLQREHENAEKEARLQAEKQAKMIADRSTRLKAQREKAYAEELNANACATVSKLRLDAWIFVKSKQDKFKLAVKLASAKKFVFVDKHGLQKIEFLEEELIEAVSRQEVECLSFGAEFEDSLERVVSRIRISS